MSIRNDLLLISTIRIWRAVMSVALVGRLQVAVEGSLVRRRAQAKMLKAGQRVAGGSLR